ncbi:MAG: tetratricopeptide repeat protein [Fibromonadaceae bacterium]|jgi:tetratricopeptide (TPR) repeat protein|nr:tetratricopeptide repeat protein [Fibromonadaceae bacterium]
MMNFAEYNARLCNKDLQEYFQYLLLERQESPQDENIKDTIAEIQGITIQGKLNGETIIELREQNKVAADLAEQGKIEESLSLIQQILIAYPEHHSAYYTLGIISFQQGNFAEALDCFKQAFEYNSFFVDAFLRIFDCSVCLGDTSELGDILNKALVLLPNDPELLEAKKHLEEGSYPERLAQYVTEKDEGAKLKKELLKLKDMLESGNSEEALEKIKGLV